MIRDSFEAHRDVVEASLPALVPALEEAVRLVRSGLAGGAKVLAMGNGGSAAQAQHLVAEMVGRFRVERAGLPALALTGDAATLTALANDFGYEQVFARQVEALGRPGDVVVAFSTSGTSPNVAAGVEAARAGSCPVVAVTGRAPGPISDRADVWVRVESDDVARIQEVHAVAVHALVDALEADADPRGSR